MQIALAALVADRTVERVIDQQELEHHRAAGSTFALCVCTTMPSVTGVLHAICSFGIPSISTKQMRQSPAGPSLGW